jgi:hypothetical protein
MGQSQIALESFATQRLEANSAGNIEMRSGTGELPRSSRIIVESANRYDSGFTALAPNQITLGIEMFFSK